MAAPQRWSTATGASDWPAAEWWHSYQTSALETLLARARAGNLDLARSATQILQADAQLRQAGASLLPQVGASASTSRNGSQASGGTGVSGNSVGAGLNASYELDFWGRNRAVVESARATLAATLQQSPLTW